MRCNYLRNKKLFPNFFMRSSNLDQILKILKTMMIIIGYVFSKKQTTNDVIRQMSKRSCFGIPHNEEPEKRSQTLLKSSRQHLCHTYWSLWRKLSWRKPPLVIFKILGLLVNTLTADDMYCLLNREYLTQPIQMQLSKKQKTFSQFFSAFLKSRSNFEHFQDDGDHHSLCISETTNCKRRG